MHTVRLSTRRLRGTWFRTTSRVVPLLVVVVALPGHGVANAVTRTAADDASRSISGTVTVDGAPADAAATLIGEVVTEASATPISCGSATVSEAGFFRMELDAACEAGMAMRMRLAELEAKDQIEVPPDSVENVLVRFESPPPPAGADSQISAAFADAEAERARPLISDTSLIVLLVLIALAAVVLLGSVARYWRADGDALKALGSQAIVIPQLLVEGLVLSLAIIAIVILGASAKLTSEGLISVLAGIVGYAAGSRAAASSRRT